MKRHICRSLCVDSIIRATEYICRNDHRKKITIVRLFGEGTGKKIYRIQLKKRDQPLKRGLGKDYMRYERLTNMQMKS